MARLREADLRVGDRLKYTIGKGVSATKIVGVIESIEKGDEMPATALFTVDDAEASQMIVRLGELARHSTRLRTLGVSA